MGARLDITSDIFFLGHCLHTSELRSAIVEYAQSFLVTFKWPWDDLSDKTMLNK